MSFNFNFKAIDKLLSNFCVDENSCWVWARGTTKHGYSTLYVDGADHYGHRLSYELFVSDIPKGHELDHLCRNRACINPEHLESVLPETNRGRGEWYIEVNRRKTTCPYGHPYSGNNLILNTNHRGGPHRVCRECYSARQKRLYQQRKARGYYGVHV